MWLWVERATLPVPSLDALLSIALRDPNRHTLSHTFLKPIFFAWEMRCWLMILESFRPRKAGATLILGSEKVKGRARRADSLGPHVRSSSERGSSCRLPLPSLPPA